MAPESNNLILSCNSWSQFIQSLENASNNQKGNAFELLTKLYFKVTPEYDFYADVWLLAEVPQKHLDIVGLPSHDLGIDLIARDGKEYHAIQCKYHYNKHISVGHKEVATFTSLLANYDKLTLGYICSSAIDKSKNLSKIQTKQISYLMADTWQGLDEDFFKKAKALLKHKPLKDKPFKPRAHQKKAIKQALTHFNKDNNSRGKLIFPCGSGKSLTGYWLTEALASYSTIIAVPSLSLVKQTLEVYLREIVAKDIKVKWLCICSDEGIGKTEDVAIRTENLGVPCKTDPVYIENWVKKNKKEHIIVFTTYQSGRIIAEVSKKLNYTFDVGIFDEAHKTVGSNKTLFSHLLFEENIAVAKRIFMTATERFYKGSNDDIISMDDFDIYGDTFAYMSFKEAIELDLLTDYKVITIDVQKAEIAEFIRENNLVQLNEKWKKETEARSLASMLALRKAMKEYPIKNAVSFHSSIDKAVRNKDLQHYITDTYEYQPIDTYTVSGMMPTTKRNDIVQEFASSNRALITNARCLTEGVDVPNIDCIVFADPRRSKVDIVQALGRALRKKEGKDWGYVILPVVYDEETHEIDNDNFQEILAIVRGLASNDERFIEYLKDKNNGTPLLGKEERGTDILTVTSEYLNEDELTKQLEIKLWDKLSQFQWADFNVAKEFVRCLGLKSANEFREYCKLKEKQYFIPSSPHIIYLEKGWISWSDWLGTKPWFDGDYLPYQEARNFSRSLSLKNEMEWRNYLKGRYPNLPKIPFNIPKTPHYIYKDIGWIGLSDWLGYESNYTKNDYSYIEAKKVVQHMGIKTSTEWREFVLGNLKMDYSLPDGFTKNPDQTFRNNGWISWGEFLGTGSVADKDKVFRDYNSAKKFVRKLNLKSRSEWTRYINGEMKNLPSRPKDIPKAPQVYYKGIGWVSQGDFLGTGMIATIQRNYLPFKEARDFARNLNLKSTSEWNEFCKSDNKPNNISANPDRTYKDKGWKSMGDWLGTFRISDNIKYSEIWDFEKTKNFVAKLGLKSSGEWRDYCRGVYSNIQIKPSKIPRNVTKRYKEDWEGWNDFLGRKDTFNFEEAKAYVGKLNLKSSSSWREYCKCSKKPYYIPSNPDKSYKEKGWKGWKDFLGSKK